MLIQIPDDAVSTGYKQTGLYQFEQVFKSASKGFEGTELEFVKAGYGYAYHQLDASTRVEINIK